MTKKKRCGGVLMHVTSLPSKYGIGTLGKTAYDFIDFLHNAGQKIWQILPLGHTGYGDSPYQCYSAFAGNPLLIDLDVLIEKAYLRQEDLCQDISFDSTEFDTSKVAAFTYPLLQKAVAAFHATGDDIQKEQFLDFCASNAFWLDDYALFMALKKHFDNKPWYTWESPVKMRMPESIQHYVGLLHSDINMYKTIQFFFFSQWQALKSYANAKGVSIFGDIPLYVAYDSTDAWACSHLFLFDESKTPLAVAGVPPDYFSKTGQLWGNPLYNWQRHEETGFEWWLSRIKANFVLYDILRIDHFRGLAAYWSVPYGEETAVKGEWIEAPGRKLFETICQNFGDIPIIAEDLGVITEDVEALRDGFGFPGMKILQFAFDASEENKFLPHTYHQNCVVYTGTHDNDTTLGWYLKAANEDKVIMHDYFNFSPENVAWEMIRLAWSSVAYMAIVPMQDLLNLDSEARMNLPGQPTGYWQWRMNERDLTEGLSFKLKHFTKLYNR